MVHLSETCRSGFFKGERGGGNIDSKHVLAYVRHHSGFCGGNRRERMENHDKSEHAVEKDREEQRLRRKDSDNHSRRRSSLPAVHCVMPLEILPRPLDNRLARSSVWEPTNLNARCSSANGPHIGATLNLVFRPMFVTISTTECEVVESRPLVGSSRKRTCGESAEVGSLRGASATRKSHNPHPPSPKSSQRPP